MSEGLYYNQGHFFDLLHQHQLLDFIERPYGITFGFPRFRNFAEAVVSSVIDHTEKKLVKFEGRPVRLVPEFGFINYSDCLQSAMPDFGLKPDLTQDFESTPELLARADEIMEDSLVKGISEYPDGVDDFGLVGLPVAPKGMSIKQIYSLIALNLEDRFNQHYYLSAGIEELKVPVIAVEFQGITSRLINGERIGLPMGNRPMERLARRLPPFDKLNYADPYIAGIATRYKVREYAQQTREISQRPYDSIEEKIRALEERGVEIDTDDPEEIVSIGKGATVRKIAVLYKYSMDVLEYMYEKDLLGLPKYFKGKEGWKRYIKDKSAVDDLIARVLLLGFIKDDLGIDSSRAFIGDNRKKLRIRYPDVKSYNVVRKFYPLSSE